MKFYVKQKANNIIEILDICPINQIIGVNLIGRATHTCDLVVSQYPKQLAYREYDMPNEFKYIWQKKVKVNLDCNRQANDEKNLRIEKLFICNNNLKY